MQDLNSFPEDDMSFLLFGFKYSEVFSWNINVYIKICFIFKNDIKHEETIKHHYKIDIIKLKWKTCKMNVKC